MLVGNHVPRWLRLALSMALVILTIVAAISWIPGCGRTEAPAVGGGPREGPPRVFVPHPPLRDLVRALVGESVVVVDPWKSAGGDPAFWHPSAEEIALVQSCELIVLNGAGFEKWAEQAALPRARVVDLGAVARDRLIVEQGETHSHGPEGAHSHAGTAFTTWLSPPILRAELVLLAERLGQLLPAERARIAAGQAECDARIAAIGSALAQVGAAQPKWLGSHPVYQYLAQAGGMVIDCVHWEPGEMPAETEWAKFGALRAGAPRPTAFMLWEGEPGQAMRDRLKAEGVEPIVFSPLGTGDGAASDFLGYFKGCVEAMRAAADRR